MQKFLELLERFDWTLIISAVTLSAIGIVAIYGIGTSRDPIDLFPFYKQFTVTIIGLAIVFGFVFIDYRHLRSYSFFIYAGGAFLLLLVLILGRTINNTQGWFRIGSLSFQPVEIAKITLTVYLAAFFARQGHRRLPWRALATSGIATLVYVGLILLQPDFGSAMILLAIWGLMAIFAGLPRRAWIILPLAAATLGALVWMIGLKPYQRDRIITFLHPQTDTQASGYNATQARIAIGSGGVFGKGIGEGSQARLKFLPEAATDFMFAVLGEELGLLGIGVILGLFFLMLFRYLRIASESEDDFAALLLIGLAGIFLIHVIVNAGMNLGIMPITGIPLPFLSAAASYLLVAFFSIGLAESVATRRRRKIMD
ncbi:MAG TPA: FtsW/RodA/SpoVE family cell cycle protein [Patescibacteria group bacterium]|nr:FtsW/RodA/SpoVE family cell cycle protein [Patescibacteria group bacterium]